MNRIAQLRAVALDCPHPRTLANFYAQLVGGEVTYEDDDWVSLRDGATVLLSFQRVDDYQAPEWPGTNRPQQFHIDVTVEDVDEAERQVLALGAIKTEHQPGKHENWRVFLDPVGHPFCLCWDQ